MTDDPRVGTPTKTIAWFIVAMLPVAALTASAVPWKWAFALLYVGIAFGLQALVRLKNPGVERFAHILVLSGSAPIAVRFHFGMDLSTLGLLHVVAVLVISIGVGYVVADRVRLQFLDRLRSNKPLQPSSGAKAEVE
jgi:hypothetical protein